MKKFLSFLLAALFLFGAVFAVSCASAKNDKKEKTGIYAAADEFINLFISDYAIPEFDRKEKGIYEETEHDVKTVREYNKNGYLVRVTCFDAGAGKWYSENIYEYDKKGKMIKETVNTDFSFRDGVETQTHTYDYSTDKKGNITEIRYGNLVIDKMVDDNICEIEIDKTEFSYDDDGKMTSYRVYTKSGDIFEKRDFSYDEENRKITSVCQKDSEKIICTTHFTNDWKIAKSETRNKKTKSVSETEYYENGNKRYNFDFSEESGGAKECFNENGKITERIKLDSDKKATGRTAYEYNDAGFPVSETYYDKADNITLKLEYNGKTNSRHIVKKYEYLHGQPRFVFEYDENNNKIKESRYNSDGALEEYILYDYDENGKLSKKSYYTPDGELYDTEYYK